jgi:PTH1 family peptidyl-tRNA hydrolase
MNLVAGLGNPGSKYVNTRHNIGFRVVEKLAEKHNAFIRRKLFSNARECRFTSFGRKLLLIQPLVFMNLSGVVVSAYLKKFRLDNSNLLVICDDINLSLGQIRIRPNGSAGGHNGLSSVIECLGTADFPRLRVGIGSESLIRDFSEYVLSDFSESELTGVEEAISQSVTACECWLRSGIHRAMNIYNR